MGIIQQAILADRTIRNTKELIEQEIETIRVVFEHNAISEDEYNRSLAVLKRRLATLPAREGGMKLSDIISGYRNSYPSVSA